MGGPSLLDFEERCRICTLKHATINLFSDVAQKKLLTDSIKKYLNIEVSTEDGLPQYVCKKCCDILCKFHRFAEGAVKSQDKLQELAAAAVKEEAVKESNAAYQEKQLAYPDTTGVNSAPAQFLSLLTESPGESVEVSVDPFTLLETNGVTTRERRRRQESEDESKLEEEELLDEEEEEDENESSCSSEEEEEDEPAPRRTRARSEREEQERDLSEFYQLSCSECGLKCTNFLSLSSHCKSAHNCRPTVRCHCGKSFNRRSHLIRHRHQHLGVHRFKCETCGRGFHFKFMLRSHMFTHGPESEKPYRCDQCPRGYITKSGLTNHRLMKHLPPRARVTCDICQHTFSHPNCLYTHKKTVHGEQRHFVCHVCGKTMSTLGNLKGHLETHRESCNVQCEVCGKRFKTRMRLVRHMEYHRSTWHECSVCGRTYQTRGALRSHLLVHSDQRPHKCSLCHKAFKRSKQLKLHLYQHTGERPYKCPHCPKTFTNAGNRATHKRRIHSKQLATAAAGSNQNLMGMQQQPQSLMPQQEMLHHTMLSSMQQQQSMLGMMVVPPQGLPHPLPPPPHNIPHILPPPLINSAHHVYSNICQQQPIA